MAQDGDSDAAARTRWLAELATVLREAEQLSMALAEWRGNDAAVILLQARIVSAINDVESLQRAVPGTKSAGIEPFWTLFPHGRVPRPDSLP